MLHDFRYDGAARYRNIAEPRILRFLCSPFELAAGHEGAETEAMRHLLQHLVDLGLPYRADAAGERRFDLAELVNFVKYAHYAFGDPTWRERSVATMRRLMASVPTGRRHTLRIRRSFERLEPGASLRLHLPKPLGATQHRVTWIDTGGAEPQDDGARTTLRARVPPTGRLTVAVQHEFVAGGLRADPPNERALRPREGLIHVGPAIVALAAQLGLAAADPLGSLRRIWDHLFDAFSFGFIHYDRLAADDPLGWCLTHRRVDCRTGSALIVALCRAAGIPARLLTGYTLHPVLPTSHCWCEAWIAGEWRPFDTYAIDLAGGERDSLWRDHFFGRLDDRFVAEILPAYFCGLGMPRLPRSWQLCAGMTPDGATTWYEEVDTGRPIYSETVSVVCSLCN